MGDHHHEAVFMTPHPMATQVIMESSSATHTPVVKQDLLSSFSRNERNTSTSPVKETDKPGLGQPATGAAIHAPHHMGQVAVVAPSPSATAFPHSYYSQVAVASQSETPSATATSSQVAVASQAPSATGAMTYPLRDARLSVVKAASAVLSMPNITDQDRRDVNDLILMSEHLSLIPTVLITLRTIADDIFGRHHPQHGMQPAAGNQTPQHCQRVPQHEVSVSTPFVPLTAPLIHQQQQQLHRQQQFHQQQQLPSSPFTPQQQQQQFHQPLHPAPFTPQQQHQNVSVFTPGSPSTINDAPTTEYVSCPALQLEVPVTLYQTPEANKQRDADMSLIPAAVARLFPPGSTFTISSIPIRTQRGSLEALIDMLLLIKAAKEVTSEEQINARRLTRIITSSIAGTLLATWNATSANNISVCQRLSMMLTQIHTPAATKSLDDKLRALSQSKGESIQQYLAKFSNILDMFTPTRCDLFVHIFMANINPLWRQHNQNFYTALTQPTQPTSWLLLCNAIQQSSFLPSEHIPTDKIPWSERSERSERQHASSKPKCSVHPTSNHTDAECKAQQHLHRPSSSSSGSTSGAKADRPPSGDKAAATGDKTGKKPAKSSGSSGHESGVWCSVHQTGSHSDEECFKQQRDKKQGATTNNDNKGKRVGLLSATESTSTDSVHTKLQPILSLDRAEGITLQVAGRLPSTPTLLPNCEILLDSLANSVHISSRLVDDHTSFEGSAVPVATLNGPVLLDRYSNITLTIGKSSISPMAIVSPNLPVGCDLLVPLHAVFDMSDSVTFNSDTSQFVLNIGTQVFTASFVSRFGHAAFLSQTKGDITEDMNAKLRAAMDAEPVSPLREASQRAPLGEDGEVPSAHPTHCHHPVETSIWNITGLSVSQKVARYCENFTTLGVPEADVTALKDILTKHQQREDSVGSIPPVMSQDLQWSNAIDPAAKGYRAPPTKFGQDGSVKSDAVNAKVADYIASGVLGDPIDISKLPPDAIVLNMNVVKKNVNAPWSTENSRVNLNGKPLVDFNLLDTQQSPDQLRRKSPMETLVNATDDPDYHRSRFFAAMDIKAAYLQSGLLKKPEEARLYVRMPKSPDTVRPVLRPMFGHPYSGKHFDTVIVSRMKPDNAKLGYVDDFLLGRYLVLTFVKALTDLLEDMYINGVTLAMKKLLIDDHLERFGVHVCVDGYKANADALIELGNKPCPTSKKEFISSSLSIRYWGIFIPAIAKALGTISDYWHGKAPMPKEEIRKQHWAEILDNLSKAVVLAHWNPNLPAYIGTDWCQDGRSKMLFQVTPGTNPRVNIVNHSYRPNNKKYERLASAFVGEIETMTEAALENMHYIENCTNAITFVGDHQPIVTASANDFRAVASGSSRRYAGSLINHCDITSALNCRYFHVPGFCNGPNDLRSRQAHILEAHAKITRESLYYQPGKTILTIPQTLIDEPTAKRIALLTLSNQAPDRLQNLKSMAASNPTDLFARTAIAIADKSLPDTNWDDILSMCTPKERAALEIFKADSSNITIADGIVTHFEGLPYVIPEKRFEFITNAHSITRAGHFGINITLNNMQHGNWPDKKPDVSAFIQLCPQCDRENVKDSLAQSGHMPIAQPLEMIHFDMKKFSDKADAPGCFSGKCMTIGLVQLQLYENSQDATTWRTGARVWTSFFGPFSVAVTDNTSIIHSKVWKDFEQQAGFVTRHSSSYHKSNGGIEIEHKFLNSIMGKVGAEQLNISELSLDINMALNSRTTIAVAGVPINPYSFLRGHYCASTAERVGGYMPAQSLFNFYDWLFSSGDIRHKYIAGRLEKRGIKFAPEDIVPSQLPELYGPGTRVFINSKAMPNKNAGNSATASKGVGPFEIVKWHPNGVTATVRNIATGEITDRNGEFIHVAKSLPDDQRAADEYDIEEILGEKRDRSGKATQYLVKWRDYGIDLAEFVPASTVHAEDLLTAWNQLDKTTRIAKTKSNIDLIDSQGKATVPKLSGKPAIKKVNPVPVAPTRSSQRKKIKKVQFDQKHK